MTLAGFTYQTLTFDKTGELLPSQATIAMEGVTDLVVIAHGWKNDRFAAASLYEGVLSGVRDAAGSDLEQKERRWSVAGVLWPALKFRPDLTVDTGTGEARDGGAAGFGGEDLSEQAVFDLARSIALDFDEADPEEFAASARQGAGGGGAADDFMISFRAMLSAQADDEAAHDHASLLETAGHELVAAERDGGIISIPKHEVQDEAAPSGQGASFERIRQVVGHLKSGGAAAMARILNQGTYFEMKARAGRVGAGLATVLAQQVPRNVRIHLIGHSFGARLVTAACSAPDSLPTETLCLLQGAFSHNALGTGFGDDGKVVGAYRNVIEERRVAGTVMITHTHRDTAVGLFYALASSVSGVIASSFGAERILGGPDDPHGGLGANGALSMLNDEAMSTVASQSGSLPELSRGRVSNVLCDEIVEDHNDVANARVGALVWKALSAH